MNELNKIFDMSLHLYEKHDFTFYNNYSKNRQHII